MKLASIDRISVLNIHYINYSLDYFLDCQQALGVKNVELLAGRRICGWIIRAPLTRRLLRKS